MKKFVFIVLIISWFGLAFYSVNRYLKLEHQQQVAIQKNLSNFEKVKNYLVNHYKGNYPIPSGNLILLDKTKTMIHLTDRNTPLSKIKNLYVIQATTCDILKNDKNFEKFNYDPNNSLWSGKNFIKRCFTYSVTADRKNFQIWTITKKWSKYIARLDGSIKNSITRSYSSPRLVKNNSDIDLPYPPKLSPVIIVNNLWKSKILAKVTDLQTFETKRIKLTEGINYLLSNPGKYDIRIIGKLVSNTTVKFVDVMGNIINLNWNDNWFLDFSVKNYEINGPKKDYIAGAGKFLANIIKLSPSSDMQVQHNWTTLVIRWTKFSINADKKDFATYLALGHIEQLVDGKRFDITLSKAFSILKNGKFISDLSMASKLVFLQVWLDVLNHEKYHYSIYNSSGLTDILTWVSWIHKTLISFDNWQKITLVKLSLNSWTNKFDDILKSNAKKLGLYKILEEIKKDNWRWESRIYKNIVNNICKATVNSAWLDISKFWYMMDTNSSKLIFKDRIKNSVWVSENNYVLLSSRHYWPVNQQTQDSIVLGYKPDDKKGITTINLKNLNYNDNLKYVLIACDGK